MAGCISEFESNVLVQTIALCCTECQFRRRPDVAHSCKICFFWALKWPCIWVADSITLAGAKAKRTSSCYCRRCRQRPYTHWQWSVHVPPGLTLGMQSLFVCFVWIWEQTAIISLHSINWLVCITEDYKSKTGQLQFLFTSILILFRFKRYLEVAGVTKLIIKFL